MINIGQAVNSAIKAEKVRVIGADGAQLGVMRVEKARDRAKEAKLDLVEVAPNADPPVVKIMDFRKHKYEELQKKRDARAKQANSVLKEVRFRLKIDDNDLSIKTKRVEQFLQGGDKVKATIMFRGREQGRPELGRELLKQIGEKVADLGVIEQMPVKDGRNMVMVIRPLAKKVKHTSEQHRSSSTVKESRLLRQKAHLDKKKEREEQDKQDKKGDRNA
ncbi:MAG: translation initiation factor IF-3 [Bifidobacteriaceae bacterium]|nr:translation initiation factor IF-3 [Bifidobacteriaceae bacterium]